MVTTPGERPGAARAWDEGASLFGLLFCTAILLTLGYFLLVKPDASYVERFLNDVFGLADGAYRVSHGLVPSIDFTSLYGAATYYPTAAGFLLDYTVGGALAFGSFLTSVFLLTLACFTARRRLSTLPSLVLLVFLFLLVAVPVRPGGAYTDLTWGILYTRHGWAGLAVVLLYYLEPRRIGRYDLWIDAAVLAALLLFLFYLKITFGAVALGFLAANAVTSGYKFRLAITSLAICMAVTLAIEVTSGYNSAYLDNIFGVVKGAAGVRRGWDGLLQLVFAHRLEIFLCYAALAVVYFTGRRSLFDFLFVTGCLVTAFMLLDQSGGTNKGLFGLIAVFLILSELAQRRELPGVGSGGGLGWSQKVASTLILGMMLGVIAEPSYVAARGLQLHFTKVAEARSAGESDLGGIYAPRHSTGPTTDIHNSLGHGDDAHAELNQRRRLQLRTWEYVPLIEEGLVLLEGVPLDGKAVVTFEQTSPFGLLLGLRPTSGGYVLNFISPRGAERIKAAGDDALRRTSERFFSDADYVMVPSVPYKVMQLEAMQTAYSDYLEEHFRELKRSEHWRLYERRQDGR